MHDFIRTDIKMKIIFLVFIILFFVNSENFLGYAFAQDENCTWKKIQELTVCQFSNSINLENSLINIEFQTSSNVNDELAIILIDDNGNKVTSNKINDWYGVLPNSSVNVSLFAKDFTRNDSQFLFDKVNEIQILTISDNHNQIEISDFFISEIKEYPNYSIRENLPIQPIFPGFIFLVIISFPSGFILLEFSRFFKNQDFFIKLPWILAFGFSIFMIFAYAVSTFWISFETIISFIVIEFIILTIYLIRNKKIKKIRFFKTKSSSSFFIAIILISGIISQITIGTTGWPVDHNDSLNHVRIVSYAVTNNVGWDGTSLQPITNLQDERIIPYPSGFHNLAAGISLVIGTFPAVSMAIVFSFMMFLIPILLTSLVYRFSRSIFFSSLMFLFSFWRPDATAYWYGDLFWNRWLGGLHSSEAGILVMFVLFLIFFEIFDKKKTKINIITIVGLTFTSLIISYYGFLALAVLIGLICLISYKSQTKKKFIFLFSPLLAFLISVPFWRPYLMDYLGKEFSRFIQNTSSHYKLLNLQPFDPSSPFFPFWISTTFGIVSACILIKNKKYRYLSITYLIIASIELLSIQTFFWSEVFFYNSGLRAITLMFTLSIVINLVFTHWLINQKFITQKLNYFKKSIQNFAIKGIIIVFFILLLIPSFQIFNDDVNNINRLVKVPGGNEKNLHQWLYQNTKSEDLVLNDHSWAAFWYIGTRGQSLINVNLASNHIARTYDHESEQFEPRDKNLANIVKANLILKNPWDYKYISKTLKELDIKYVYLSERTSPKVGGCNTKCYPDSKDWSWKNYDGNARIGMYENHPNLELVLRNGNSAIFKVI